MGLDVYCYKIKDKNEWKKYVKAANEFNDYSCFLWKKYKTETNEAYNKWDKWYNDLIDKYENNEISDDEFNTELEKEPYRYSILDFVTSDEQLKYKLLMSAKDAVNCEKTKIDELYMRKQYWFIQYCYHKFEQYLIDDDELKLKVLDNDNHYYDMLLNKEDIADIIDKLTAIVNNCNSLMNINEIKDIINKVKIDCYDYDKFIETKESTKYNKLAVSFDPKDKHIDGIVDVNFVDSLFPVYKDYVHSYRPSWNYIVHRFSYYLEEWKKVYDEMTEEQYIWINESW